MAALICPPEHKCASDMVGTYKAFINTSSETISLSSLNNYRLTKAFNSEPSIAFTSVHCFSESWIKRTILNLRTHERFSWPLLYVLRSTKCASDLDGTYKAFISTTLVRFPHRNKTNLRHAKASSSSCYRIEGCKATVLERPIK